MQLCLLSWSSLRRSGFFLAIILAIGEIAFADSGFPKTLDSGKGRTITLKQPPQRIVSMLLSTDEMLSVLVDKSRIQAVSYIAANDSISNVAEWSRDIPHKIQMDIEQILACEPDIVFMSKSARAEIVDMLLKAEIPVVQFDNYDSIGDLQANLYKVGEALGAQEKAQAVIRAMDDDLRAIDVAMEKVKDRPKVMNYSITGFVAGKGTTVDEFIVRGGGINVAAENGIKSRQKISVEKIIEWNPDVILLSGYMPKREGFPDEFRADPALQTVNAIKNNRVYVITGKHLTTLSQFVVKGAQDVARLLHPECFANGPVKAP